MILQSSRSQLAASAARVARSSSTAGTLCLLFAAALTAWTSGCAAGTAPPRETPARGVEDGAHRASAGADHDDSAGRRTGGKAGVLIELTVPGFLPAVVHVPAGDGRHPLVVASHGAGGAPEWECEYWRELSEARAFVLCPRGARTDVRFPSGYYYPTHHALEREVVAAVRALHRRFGSRLHDGGGIYAGFSQGAIMGAAMIPRHGREFPYLVLIEGGYEYWSLSRAREFARRGGKRVLFVCGTRWCADKSREPASWLERAGSETRIEYAPGAGHTPAGSVMDRARAAQAWLLRGDPIWTR